eukprot:10666080-Alexandrium_andersonii.AAC.1
MALKMRGAIGPTASLSACSIPWVASTHFWRAALAEATSNCMKSMEMPFCARACCSALNED